MTAEAVRSAARSIASSSGETQTAGKPGADYDARAVRRGVATRAAADLVVRVAPAAAALTLASLRALVAKHRSSACSTLPSTSGVFSPRTSVISETTRNFARSNIRFSRNDRLLDLLR